MPAAAKGKGPRGGRGRRSRGAADDEEEAQAAGQEARRAARGVGLEVALSRGRGQQAHRQRQQGRALRASGAPRRGARHLAPRRAGAAGQESVDKKWINVDIGGGETAWIEPRRSSPGEFRAAPAERRARRRGAAAAGTREGAKEAKVAEREPEPPPAEVEKAEPPPPPPPPPQEDEEAGRRRSRRPSRRRRRRAQSRGRDAAAATKRRARQEADEKKKGKKPLRLARATTARDIGSRTQHHRERRSSRTLAGSRAARSTYAVGVRARHRHLSQRFTSNGTGALANYEAIDQRLRRASSAVGVYGALGNYFRLGGDG